MGTTHDNELEQMRRRRPIIFNSVVAVAAFALLAAGCGGGGSPAVANVASTATTTATTTQSSSGAGGSAVGGSSAAPRGGGNHTVINIGNATEGAKFAACMRRHGVPSFPDPNPQGMIQFGSGIDPHSPIFRSAQHSCQSLLPTGFGQPPSAAQLAQVQQELVAFSKCMRARGISDFPDPSGAALPQIQPTGDLDPNNPQFQTAYNACKAHLPSGLPSKALGGLAPPATGNSGGG